MMRFVIVGLNLLASPAAGLDVARWAPPQDPCPFGFCDGGDKPIDSAPKAMVANILTGVLSNLEHSKGLVQKTQKVTKNGAGLLPERDPCPFGYCDGGSQPLDSATKAQVANILNGILTNLQHSKGLVQKTQKVTKTGAGLLLDRDPCPFGYCDGGSKPLDSATTTQVANTLNGILSNLEHSKGLVQEKQKVHKAGAGWVPDRDPCPFGYCDGGSKPLDSATKSQVANILNGILTNLQHSKGLVQEAQKVSKTRVGWVPPRDPCPFGFCDGGSKPLDAATKAQVAGILNGILSNLEHSKGLVQESQKVGKFGTGALVSQRVHEALKNIADKLFAGDQASKLAAGIVAGASEPIDAATKAKVAQILGGIIGRLSKGH